MMPVGVSCMRGVHLHTTCVCGKLQRQTMWKWRCNGRCAIFTEFDGTKHYQQILQALYARQFCLKRDREFALLMHGAYKHGSLHTLQKSAPSTWENHALTDCPDVRWQWLSYRSQATGTMKHQWQLH